MQNTAGDQILIGRLISPTANHLFCHDGKLKHFYKLIHLCNSRFFLSSLTRTATKKTIKLSDLLLVEQCKQNNRKAQMALYRQYCEGMFVIANRYMKDTAAVEDAMQDAFIKAFSKIHQYKGDVTFGAWLKRIVINTCLDQIKARKVDLYAINEEVLAQADEDDWQVDDETSVEEIMQAIDELPQQYKVVVKMFLLEGYDHAEISDVLGISESASRTNLYRGKQKLQQTLNHLRYGTGY